MKTSRKGAKAQRVEYLVEIGDDGGEFCATAREALDAWVELSQVAGDKPVLAYKVIPITRRELYEGLAHERVGVLTPAGRAAAGRRAS